MGVKQNRNQVGPLCIKRRFKAAVKGGLREVAGVHTMLLQRRPRLVSLSVNVTSAQLLPPFKMEKVPMQMQLQVCIMNYLLFAASIFFVCWVASPIVGAAADAAAFPSWVFGNHTACSACSHFQPIDVDAVNAKAYARALLCNISQPVVIVPGDTPVRTTRPLQMVRPRMLTCTYCPPPAAFTHAHVFISGQRREIACTRCGARLQGLRLLRNRGQRWKW